MSVEQTVGASAGRPAAGAPGNHRLPLPARPAGAQGISDAGRARGRRANGRGPAAEESLDPREILRALQAAREGDFSVRLPTDRAGIAGKIADAFNEIVGSNQHLTRVLERAGRTVGREGHTRHRVALDRRSGAWGAMVASVNTLIEDLLWPTAEVTRAMAALAKGDRGKCLEAGASDYVAQPVNTDRLSSLVRTWLHR